MGFLFKSAIGLGVVYCAMFGQALRSDAVGPAANLCASAVGRQLAGDSSFDAQWKAAGCVAALATIRVKTAPTSASAPAPRAKPRPGTLTEADLAEPWFGPARSLRKAGGRG
jgi:hypothetical protein